MTSWSTVQETPGQPASSIAYTSGSTITIRAPAEKVYAIITDFQNYSRWNTWSPKFEFTGTESITVGSEGVLTAKMENQNRTYDIPVKILECSSDDKTGRYVLAWRGRLMPSWFVVAERMQTVTALAHDQSGDASCEVKSWESMSGWGAYLLDFLLGVKKQLDAANLKYVRELKDFAERSQ